MSQFTTLVAAALATALVTACGDSTGATRASLTAVNPTPAATAVSTSTPIMLTFGQAMMPGMEQYLDLHQGTIAGPTVPMGCGWNSAVTVLTCMPNDPLESGTHYLIHVGAGMTDAHGDMMDMSGWSGMGGQWATSGMMGGMHGGQPIGMMGSGWMDGSGHYGMTFDFTTN
jgi:Big-like domain-containing protein